MDYFDVLLGGGTQDPERMKEVARQLRRQQAYGTLGALTGDPVLSQIGSGMVERAGTRAQGLQKARQAAEMMDYRRSEAERQGRQWGATARALGGGYYEQGGKIKDLPGYQESQERAFQKRVLLQTLKNQGKGGEDYRDLSTSLENRAQTQAANLENLKMLQKSFKPEYAQPLREQLGEMGAGLGPMHNLSLWAARTFGAGTQQAKDAEEWYGTWRRFMTLPVRNELFGATLTPSEQKAWDAALEIGPGMDEEQITKRIATLFEEAERSAKRRARTMLAEKYRPETVKAIFGDALGEGFFAVEKGPEGEAVVAGETSYSTVEEVGEALQAGEITEEQAEELWRQMGAE